MLHAILQITILIWHSAAKPSKPSRAYFHVTKQEFVTPLGDHIRTITFHDAAKSWQDPALVGPPALEYAPYPKMPGGRRRNDNRQGTIDQDQDFKDFLESLTNPISKPAAPEGEQAKDVKVKTTPLIEALREKKANKEKPSTKGRGGRGEKDVAEKKVLTKAGKENAANTGDKNRKSTKGDKAQATKEAVKILNKEASKNANAEKASASPAPERKRGNVALAKSMLQRDLGVGPGPAPNRRRGTKRETGGGDAAAQAKEEPKAKEAPATQTATPDKAPQASQKKERPTRAERRAFKASLENTTNNKSAASETKPQPQPQGKAPTTPAPQILKKPQTPNTPNTPKGQAASRAPPTEPAATRTPAPAKAQTPAPPTTPAAAPARSTPSRPVPDATSKQAFLKHANPSQGITEPLIEEALKVFGVLEKVEIDKRKGFAYVDFAGPEGLQKAMAASPIKIAQGAVQVLERKAPAARAPRFNAPPQGPPHGPPTGPARGGRGGGFAPRGRGRGGGRGGANNAAPAASTPPAPAAPAAPAPAAGNAT
jgi:regulator of nonsense transcripts 3